MLGFFIARELTPDQRTFWFGFFCLRAVKDLAVEKLVNDQQDMNTASKKWGSVHRMAHHYEVSVPTIWRWVREGVVPPPVKITTGCSRWNMEVVAEHEKMRGI